MEERITSYLTLNQVVKSFMNEKNEQGLVNFERYLQMAIEGYSDIQIFNINSVEVAYLSVDPDTKIAKLPADYIAMSKIAVNVCGQLVTLTVNNDITPLRPETICSAPIEDCTDCLSQINSGYYFSPFWYQGQYITTLYSVGGGFNFCYYKIDVANGRILFNGNVPHDEVILEYISSGVTAGGTPIPRQAAQSLKAYLHWRSCEYDNRVPMNEKVRKEQLYNIELNALRRLEYSFTMSEFLDTFWSCTGQGIKR